MLKKEFIGSVVKITDPINISINVCVENEELLRKFNLNHLFDDNDINDGISEQGSVNTKRKK